jgi:hypothetical protein
LNDLPAAATEFATETNSLVGLTGLAIVRHRQDQRAAAQAAFDQLVADHGDAGLYQQAQVLAQWNDVARALDALARARAAGDAGLVYLRNDPLVDPLRKAPAFSQLLTGLGFT